MTKLFFLGATGHIGGAVVQAISTQFPHVQITALVRDKEKAQNLESHCETIRTKVGDFSDVNLLERLSEDADIVINTAPDSLNGSDIAISAITRTLAGRDRSKFYIHTSGAFLVSEDTGGQRASEKTWSDIADIVQLITLPTHHYHQRTDQLVRDSAINGVNVAIVSPTVVIGLSPSTENPIPITIRDIVATAKEISTGFTMSRGDNVLSHIHVNDLARVYVALLADAIKGGRRASPGAPPQLWGPEAYYFVAAEELTFRRYMEVLVSILRTNGVLSTSLIEEIGPNSDASKRAVVEKTALIHGYGFNVRCRSDRAKMLLGWQGDERGVEETLPEVVHHLLSRNPRLVAVSK